MRLALAALAAAIIALGASATADAAATPGTPVHASPQQVAQLLFVAGDVNRLSQIPSGTEDVVLEKVLQGLYDADPALAASTAVNDIHGLQSALTNSTSLTPAALTVMTGNQRIVAIIGALQASNPSAEVTHALAQVADQALNGSSNTMALTGKAFDPSADSLDTLSYGGFSPGQVLLQTATEAASNKLFGQAWDSLWQQASHESVFDSTQTLLGENPALNSSAIQALTAMLNGDGSLDTTVGALETIINSGITQIDRQNCALAPGSTGGSAADCTAGALADARIVAVQCPNGAASTGTDCMAARNQAASDSGAELSAIAAARAANAAAADALGLADAQLQQAESAASQAAAQIADEENQYLSYQSTQQYVKAGFDVATEVVTLAKSEIDPVAAFTGLLGIVGDAVGFGFNGPDQNMILLQGIQNVSQQISDFENYTQSAFRLLDGQLSNLTTQVAQDTFQLSAQLTQAQGQISQVATVATRLQDSVDHLQSEVQTLFAANANNDLGTLTNTYLGYFQINGTQLSAQQFATAAGALYQDATGTALSPTVLGAPGGFDALSADGLVTSTDPVLLDTNINYFNYFPTHVTDSGVSWPGNVTDTCAPGAAPANGTCLPNPDFWASAARAFAQLLAENPQYVTPARLQQLATIQQEGQLIQNALAKLSVNDAGAEPGGTGNRTLDAALSYYRYWGAMAHGSGAAPALVQAIRNEEHAYLQTQPVSGQPFSYDGVDPWGGLTQSPDKTTLQSSTSFTDVPPCVSFARTAGINTTDANYHLSYIPAGDFSFLDPHVLNAVRLGVGHISTCWAAEVFGQQPGGSGPDGLQGNLLVSLLFTYVSNDGQVTEQVGTIANNVFTSDCTNDGDTNPLREGADNVIGNWAGSGRNAACADLAPVVAQATLNGTSSVDQAVPSYPDDVAGAITGPSTAILTNLQSGIYHDLIGSGSLTSGSSQATDVQSAAERLGGAQAILDGYVSLGLPQALASDDTLHGLVSGQNADALAPNDLNLNIWNTAPAQTVPAQVVNFYKSAQAAMPGFDPVGQLANLIVEYQNNLQTAIQPHIVGPSPAQAQADQTARTQLAARLDATSQGALKLTAANVLLTGVGAGTSAAPAPGSGVLPESDQVISPTLTRLGETQMALQDSVTNGARLQVSVAGTGSGTVSDGSAISCPGTCGHTYSAGQLITLTAQPSSGSSFTGWSGACTGTSPTCRFVLTYDQTATATFRPAPAGGAPAPTTTTTSPTTTTKSAATPGSPAGAGTPPAPRCTLQLATNRVLVGKARQRVKARPGTLSVSVVCTQRGHATLTGTLTRLIGPKPKHGKQRKAVTALGPAQITLSAGRKATVTLKLPQTAVTALAQNAPESVTLSLTLGGRRFVLTQARLRAQRA